MPWDQGFELRLTTASMRELSWEDIGLMLTGYTLGPLYLPAPQPQIVPTVDQKYLEKNLYRKCTGFFFLSFFSNQDIVTTIDI